MARFSESSEIVKCSFCGKAQNEVEKLIAGPGVYICNECIDLCNGIVEEEGLVKQEGNVIHSPPASGPASPGQSAMAAQLIEARERLTGTLGRLPTVAELATELGLDETEVTAALRQVSQGEWRTSTGAPTTDAPDLPPVSVVLRMIQQEVNQLSQRLAELVERVEQ